MLKIRFQVYCFKSVIAICAWQVTWNYAHNPFISFISYLPRIFPLIDLLPINYIVCIIISNFLKIKQKLLFCQWKLKQVTKILDVGKNRWKLRLPLKKFPIFATQFLRNCKLSKLKWFSCVSMLFIWFPKL